MLFLLITQKRIVVFYMKKTTLCMMCRSYHDTIYSQNLSMSDKPLKSIFQLAMGENIFGGKIYVELCT